MHAAASREWALRRTRAPGHLVLYRRNASTDGLLMGLLLYFNAARRATRQLLTSLRMVGRWYINNDIYRELSLLTHQIIITVDSRN